MLEDEMKVRQAISVQKEYEKEENENWKKENKLGKTLIRL